MSQDRNEYGVHDASIFLWSREGPEERFGRLMALLTAAGYEVARDPYYDKQFPTLAHEHRLVRRDTPAGPFWCAAHWCRAYIELKCYQERVTDNPHGGRYDFGRERKMPFLIRVRWLAFRRLVDQFAAGEGFTYRRRPCEIADLAERYTSGWQLHPSRIGPDGWPNEKELASWPYKLADGVKPEQGMVAYGICDRTKRFVRGRIFGGINGMWQLYDAKGELLQNHTASHYYTFLPLRGRRMKFEGRQERFRQHFRAAMLAKDYRRVARMAEAAAVHGYDMGA